MESKLTLEREMSKLQRGLVDTCFEEGQYESGIAILKQLRRPDARPSHAHVRQLLYIALYPPLSESMGFGGEDEILEPASPSKIRTHFKKLQKSPLIPSPSASEAAVCLLISFSQTNRPRSVFTALPEYSVRAIETRGPSGEEEESFIAREAYFFEEARHCWAILKRGFIQRKKRAPPTPKGKGRKRQREFLEDDLTVYHDDNFGQSLPVAEYAWPVLEWLIILFERDEQTTQRDSPEHPAYSQLLLSQIPPPRSGSGPRWDAELPVDVVLHCLSQIDVRRKQLGARLLTLLINLTSTILIDLNAFMSLIYNRLALASHEHTKLVLSILRVSPSTAYFKFLLCRKYLSEPSRIVGELCPTSPARPRRVARQVRGPRGHDPPEDPDMHSPSKTAPPQSLGRKCSLPTCAEVVKLLLSDGVPHPLPNWIKFEFILAYVQVLKLLARENEAESLITLRDAVEGEMTTIFSDAEGSSFQQLLTAVMVSW